MLLCLPPAIYLHPSAHPRQSMGRTVVLVAAMLLLLLLVLRNRAALALHCRDGAMPTLECQAIEVHAEAVETSDIIGVATSLDGPVANFQSEAKKLGHRPSDSELDELKKSRPSDSFVASPAQDAGTVKVLCNDSLSSFVASPDHDTSAQDAGTGNGFCNDPLVSFVPSQDHDTAAEDAGVVKVLCNESLGSFVPSPDHYAPPQGTGKGFCNDPLVSFVPSQDHGTAAEDAVRVFRNKSLASFVPSPDHDTSAHDAGTGKGFCNERLTSFVPSQDHDTASQDAVRVFCSESLASFVPSPDHDTSAHDADTVNTISALFLVVLLWISVGIKWKTPRKVHILRTVLLLASITHYVDSVEPALPPPSPTVLVQFDINIFEPTFVQQRDELVVKPNCPVVDGHYIMPMEEFGKNGVVKPPPRWIRVDSVGEVGKQSSVILRGDTNYLLAFVDENGLVHFMGEGNAKLFQGAHRLPFKETYRSLFDIENEKGEDTVERLQTIPLGKSYTEVANTVLSGYTSTTPEENVRRAILNYVITLGESQRIKSLGDRLRKNWDTTTFLTEEEAKNIVVWGQLCEKWCAEDLGNLDNKLNKDLIERGMFSIAAINNTIDLVKLPWKRRGRCELPRTQE